MKLKISDNPSDQSKIEAMLQSVNGQADRHTYTSASEIIAIAQQAEKRLDQLLLPKKYRAGVVAAKTSGGKVPTSYGYRRIATRVVMKRGTRAWYLTYVLKTEVDHDNPEGRLSMTLTQEQDKIVTENLRKNYNYNVAAPPSASDVSAAA
jgi:hypothetical protein